MYIHGLIYIYIYSWFKPKVAALGIHGLIYIYIHGLNPKLPHEVFMVLIYIYIFMV